MFPFYQFYVPFRHSLFFVILFCLCTMCVLKGGREVVDGRFGNSARFGISFGFGLIQI